VEDKPACEGANPALEIVISGNKALAFENERMRAENSKLHVEATEARNERDRWKQECERMRTNWLSAKECIERQDAKVAKLMSELEEAKRVRHSWEDFANKETSKELREVRQHNLALLDTIGIKNKVIDDMKAEQAASLATIREQATDLAKLRSDLEVLRGRSARDFSQIDHLDRKLRDAYDKVTEQENTIATLRLKATCHSCQVATGDLRAAKEAAEHYREEWENAKARERDKEKVIERLKTKTAVWPQERPVAYCISMPDPEDTKVHSLSFDKASLGRVVTAHGGKIEPLYRMK
jgi:chromosome segregation ATPase